MTVGSNLLADSDGSTGPSFPSLSSPLLSSSLIRDGTECTNGDVCILTLLNATKRHETAKAERQLHTDLTTPGLNSLIHSPLLNLISRQPFSFIISDERQQNLDLSATPGGACASRGLVIEQRPMTAEVGTARFS